jgi:hypothetical protein
MPRVKPPTAIYRLKLTLLDIDPPIWRRLEIPGSTKLCCVHTAIQVAMGWTESHLHQFEKGEERWGVLEPDEGPDLLDESKVTLAELLVSEGDIANYRYDFGDDWVHEMVLEKILPASTAGPACVAGERRCPPEDSGGPFGYQDFLDVIFNPADERYEELLGWAGGHFHDTFDHNVPNRLLSKMRWPVRHPW